MRCKTHPKYLGHKAPRSICEYCWLQYLIYYPGTEEDQVSSILASIRYIVKKEQSKNFKNLKAAIHARNYS